MTSIQGCEGGAKELEAACFGLSQSGINLAGSGSGHGVDILTIFGKSQFQIFEKFQKFFQN